MLADSGSDTHPHTHKKMVNGGIYSPVMGAAVTERRGDDGFWTSQNLLAHF